MHSRIHGSHAIQFYFLFQFGLEVLLLIPSGYRTLVMVEADYAINITENEGGGKVVRHNLIQSKRGSSSIQLWFLGSCIWLPMLREPRTFAEIFVYRESERPP